METMMKKLIYVMNLLKLIDKLEAGRRVKGVLYLERDTHRLIFEAYNVQEESRKKDELVKKTPWGWVRRSKCRLKRFSSIPLDMPLEDKLCALDSENRMQKNSAVDLELIEFC